MYSTVLENVQMYKSELFCLFIY